MAVGNRVQGHVVHFATLWLVGWMLAACGSDDGASGEEIIGSGELDEAITEAMFVESVRVDLPFEATIYNGEERQVRLYGEDNLLPHITVTEVEAGAWEISAPSDLMFEQHDEIEIEVPYIEMVSITVVGRDHITFGDNPYEVWHEDESGAKTSD